MFEGGAFAYRVLRVAYMNVIRTFRTSFQVFLFRTVTGSCLDFPPEYTAWSLNSPLVVSNYEYLKKTLWGMQYQF